MATPSIDAQGRLRDEFNDARQENVPLSFKVERVLRFVSEWTEARAWGFSYDSGPKWVAFSPLLFCSLFE